MVETKQKIVKKKKVEPLIVKEHEAKPPVKVKTPYPEEEKKTTSDVDFIGEELVKINKRVNELELSMSDLQIKLKQVSGRMGL